MGLNNKCRRAKEMEAGGFRRCARCKEVQPLHEFLKTTPNGCKGCYCHPCRRERSKEFTKKNPGRYNDAKKTYREKNQTDINLRSRCGSYGITVSEYLEMFRVQNGKCKICGVPHLEADRGLFIDHSHKSGKVRGLLCFHCNSMLGHAKESTVTLKNAIEYIEVETAGSYTQESNF